MSEQCYFNGDHTIYGLFPGGDPRNFIPDEECCSEEEIEAHRVACQEWDEGRGSDRGPSCATRGDGSAWTGTGYGLGVYSFDCEECGIKAQRLVPAKGA